jgi:D-inositol-3-phosphate glycosyltransferase
MERHTYVALISEHANPTATLGGADAGGQNVYVDELSRNLARRGHAVDIFTRRTAAEEPEMIDWAPGVRIIHLPAGPIFPRPKDELWPYMPDFRDSFLRFMEREEAQYNLIHGNFWMSGWVATELRRRLGIPVVQIFHATGKTKRRHQKRVDTSPGDRIGVEMQVIRDVDRVIAQCPCERDELIKDYEAEPEKVIIIPSAVNTKVFRPVEREEARQHIGLDVIGKVIVYVGRILPRKDVRNIVRALAVLLRQYEGMADAPPVTLLVVGGETEDADPLATPEIGELQKLAQQLGVADHVRFMGKHPASELRYYYGASDVFVTTPWYEPFGLTPLEAMACGRPVIGSSVGGITFTVKEGETGFLVPPRDPEALAARLNALFADPEAAPRMERAARKRVEREFTWSIVAMRTAALYDSIFAEQIHETLPLPIISTSRTLESNL